MMVGELADPLRFDPHLANIHELVDPDYEEYDDIDFVRWEKDALVVQAYGKQEVAIKIIKLREMLTDLS